MSDIPIPQLGFTLQWRNRILVPYIHAREQYKCKTCYRNSEHVHEGIITRGDVQGWKPKRRRVLIFHPANTVALCHIHHNTALEPSRLQVFDWSIDYYGKDFVYGWLESIAKEFKILPPILKEVLV